MTRDELAELFRHMEIESVVLEGSEHFQNSARTITFRFRWLNEVERRTIVLSCDTDEAPYVGGWIEIEERPDAQ